MGEYTSMQANLMAICHFPRNCGWDHKKPYSDIRHVSATNRGIKTWSVCTHIKGMVNSASLQNVKRKNAKVFFGRKIGFLWNYPVRGAFVQLNLVNVNGLRHLKIQHQHSYTIISKKSSKTSSSLLPFRLFSYTDSPSLWVKLVSTFSQFDAWAVCADWICSIWRRSGLVAGKWTKTVLTCTSGSSTHTIKRLLPHLQRCYWKDLGSSHQPLAVSEREKATWNATKAKLYHRPLVITHSILHTVHGVSLRKPHAYEHAKILTCGYI